MSDVHTAVAGEHTRHHAHHFESAEAEFDACKQGMWIFLVTEVLMIGGLFVGYTLFRGMNHDAFHEAHKMLNVKLGATNTVVLITSSVTMLLGVTSAQRGQRSKSMKYLIMTFLLACCFLVVKYFEYSAKFHHGLLPGGNFTNEELTNPRSSLFFSFYFLMTGVHAFHVVVGMGLMAWLMKRTANKDFGPDYYTPVELVGFYWHFVDLVWIYLFPLLYLVG
ncbi:MAG: cytochrome c oxidase subunit 3 family protein [Methylotenera sp.]|nr:cytochrome c oxidase subunit 3 family protein [Oligoflexia bacterium]